VAVLTSTQVIPMYTTGGADILGLYALRFVNAGDTIDLSTIGAPVFQLLVRCVVLGVTDAVGNYAVVSGTVATMPAGLSSASGWLLAWGMLELAENLNRTQSPAWLPRWPIRREKRLSTGSRCWRSLR
jgi:hypothetical protein